MIRKIEREFIFNQHKTSASEVSEIQKVIYHNDDLELFESEAERNDYLSQFDLLEESVDYHESLHTVLAFDYSELKTYPAELSKRLTALFTDLDVTDLMVLGHLKMNFFGNLETDHSHLKKAYSDLKQIVGTDYYDEGFKIGIQDLETFIPIVFWMQRIDSTAPEFIFFFDNKNRFSFYICNSGNIHILSYNNELFNSAFLERHHLKTVDQCATNFV